MIKLYSRLCDHHTIMEIWGGSTKHPDCKFDFVDFKKSEWVSENAQIFQWILECASKMNFPFHAEEIAKYAMKLGWKGWCSDGR